MTSIGVPPFSRGLLLLACAAAAQEFPLESYVPADFHRRYLSVSPGFDWSLRAYEGEATLAGRDDGSAAARGSLDAVHGSERRGRALLWSTVTSLSLHGRGDASDRTERVSFAGTESRRVDGDWEDGQFSYGAATRLSGRWYVAAPFFLSASTEQDLQHAPRRSMESRSSGLYPSGFPDSVLYIFREQEDRWTSFRYSGAVRAAAGFGRIEDVAFAEAGLHILDRIAEVTGRRVRLSPEGMRALEAHVEARRKGRPFADHRLAAIHDVESIDTFLREREGLEALPARAVLHMADEWGHAFRHPRGSGWEWTVYPFYRWHLSRERSRAATREYLRLLPADPAPDPDTLSPEGLDPDPSAAVRSRSRAWWGETAWGMATRLSGRRPWRRAWQFEADLLLRWSRVDRELESRGRIDTVGGTFPAEDYRRLAFGYPLLEAEYSAAVRHYPHSRTEVGLVYAARASRKLDYVLEDGEAEAIRDLVGRDLDQDVLAWSQRLGLEGRYFVNHRLSADVQASAEHRGSDSEDEIRSGFPSPWDPPAGGRYESSLAFQVWAGLTYYLF